MSLTSDWECSLVPARDVQDVDRGWKLSYEERQNARKQREEQIEQDRQDFDRLLRLSVSRRDARACSDFSTYVTFISDHLRIARSADGEDLTRILRDAVRDGQLIPAIDRAWRGSRRVARQYAPQSWAKRAPDPKPTVYGVRNGQYLPLNADGSFVDDSPYIPVRVAAKAATASAGACFGGSGDESGFDWLGAAETIAGATFGGAASSDDDHGDSMLKSFRDTDDGDSASLLGDAQPLGYSPGMPGGEAIDVAGIPSMNGDPNSWIESGPGMKKQWRMYGTDGSAAVDIDFDSHHGQPNPHAHNWDGTSRDQGWPVSIFPR
ncbi:hypothetical protein [Caballeronia catudaia]|uniref:hypothetical protein n=1 Tax=Caballeronia catudaia TaxID=1777136 RepID=UPI001180E10A|nr:hypothetical protein [Caballeronia catudaia]